MNRPYRSAEEAADAAAGRLRPPPRTPPVSAGEAQEAVEKLEKENKYSQETLSQSSWTVERRSRFLRSMWRGCQIQTKKSNQVLT